VSYTVALTPTGWQLCAPQAPVVKANKRLPKWAVPFVPGDGHAGDREKHLHDAERQSALLAGDKKALYELQQAIFRLPDLDMPLQHVFAPGLYLRTIYIPAHGLVVGKIHKHRHANVLSQGRVVIFTEHGGVERWEGPLTMVSEPGTKRAVYAETDTYWTTIHLNPSNTQDLAALEEDIIAPSYDDYQQWLARQPNEV
jgi:hypothetical protein